MANDRLGRQTPERARVETFKKKIMLWLLVAERVGCINRTKQFSEWSCPQSVLQKVLPAAKKGTFRATCPHLTSLPVP